MFTGFAASVMSMQDVSDVLEMVKYEPSIAASNHLIFAYKMGPNQNFNSDGDYGVGLHLLRYMQSKKMDNIICIVAHDRNTDSPFIGKRRMQHAVTVCEKATQIITK